MKTGLKPGPKSRKLWTTTTGKYTPPQAEKLLSLPGKPGQIIEIDVGVLKQKGIPIPKPTYIKPHYGQPGGGWEVIFEQKLPPEALKVIPIPK